jgi:hypothetical protein
MTEQKIELACVPTVVSGGDGEGCGAAWTERRMVDPSRDPYSFVDNHRTTCPRCGRSIRLAATIGALASPEGAT